MKKQQGFTLLELVFVIALTSIIVVVASNIIAMGAQTYLAAKNTVDADWQARLSLERMARDIRAVRSVTSISTATATQLVFTDFDGTSISYSLSGTSLMRNSQILADGVSSLAFGYFDKNGVTTAVATLIRYVTITLNITQSNSNFSLNTAVYLRDLA